MARSTKDAWLSGPGDLKEAEVEDVPVPGQSVKIRALSATAANAATSEALTTSEHKGQQVMKVDSVKLDIQRFHAGVIEPQFTVDEVRVISGKYGPAFQKVVRKIAEISDINPEAVAETEARFPGSGSGETGPNGDGAAGGDGGPTVPERAAAGTGDLG